MTAPDEDPRLACEDLLIRSYRLVDDGNASRVTELFTQDGRFSVEGIVNVSGHGSLARFFAAREADTSRRTRLVLGHPSFLAASAEEATIRTTLMLFVLDGSDATTPQALADVEDRYRLESGRWRIAERITTPLAGGA